MELAPIVAYHAGFRTHFKDLGQPNKFLDENLTAITRVPKLDVIRFDDIVQGMHAKPGLEESTAQLVERVYGADAVTFLRQYI